MSIETQIAKAKENHKKECTTAFHDFMDEALVRITISALPSDVTKLDAFNLLLSAAFERGFDAGTANVVQDLARSVMSAKRDQS